MKRIGKLVARAGTIMLIISMVAASGVPVCAYEGQEGAKTSDVAVTFTFTPKTPNSGDNEEIKDDPDGGGDNPGDKDYNPGGEVEPEKKPEAQEEAKKQPENGDENGAPESNDTEDFVKTISYGEAENPEPVCDTDVVKVPKEAEGADKNVIFGAYKKGIQRAVNKEKDPWDIEDAVPYIVVATVGVITVGAAASGALSGLWVLLLGLLFRKRKKRWSGLLTYTSNIFMTVRGRDDSTEDMQDILDKGVSIEELRAIMADSGVETILPVNTKMVIDVEGVRREFEADEEVFYRELEGKTGDCMVSFYNGAARLEFDVTIDLGTMMGDATA